MKIFIQDNDGELFEIEELDGIENFEFYRTPPRELVVEKIQEALKGLGVKDFRGYEIYYKCSQCFEEWSNTEHQMTKDKALQEIDTCGRCTFHMAPFKLKPLI